MSEQLQLDEEEVSITLRRAWDRALRLLAARVNKPTFETHIRAIKPLSLAEGTEGRGSFLELTLGVPSAFTREWIEKRHSVLITAALEEVFDRDVRVRFTLTPRESSADNGAGGSDSTGTAGPKPTLALAAAAVTATSIGAAAPVNSNQTDAPWQDYAPTETLIPATPKPVSRSTGKAASTSAKESFDAFQLNPRYTFDNFVVGPSNRLAQAGAQAVAKDPGVVYNPLFVYGPSGLGKTHLMHAIGNAVVAAAGGGSGATTARVAYMSGEMFTSGYVNSLREHRADEFRRRWRSVDIWLVDDIQFIAGKEATKEEFFHTFNVLYQSGKQIVISSDRSPRELRMMDERLRSRFECGLIADIAPPDLETRLAILQRKSQIERMRIPDEVLMYMARLVRSNIRTLEGALVKLIAYASLVNVPVTLELAANALERYYHSSNETARDDGGAARSSYEAGDAPGEQAAAARTFAAVAGLGSSSGITPELVKRIVAKRYGLTTEALSGKKRDRGIVVARQVAMHLTRELTQMSMPTIGRSFGGRDHTTVAYSCDKVRSQLPVDDEFRRVVEDLLIQVKAAQAPE